MKKKVVIFLFLLLSYSLANAQTKKEDINTLVIMTGSVEIGLQVLNTMLSNYKEILPDVPMDYWSKIIEKISIKSFIDRIIPIYDKYYTHEEIKELLKFYNTDLGKKTIKILPQMTNDSMHVGKKWGMEIAEEIIKELQKDGYI